MKLRDLLYLNRSDRRVLLVLLSVALVAVVVYFLLDTSVDRTTGEPASADSQHHRTSPADKPAAQYYYVEGRRVERFAFDPNTADSTQLLRLGLQPWQVRNIYKYRAAGGIYREKADFAQLYGLTVKQYRELEPYIQISPDYRPASTLHVPRQYDYHADRQAPPADTPADSLSQPRRSYTPKIPAGTTVDLNALDTAVYMTVPGIGSYRARRILDYGRRLGGYVSVDQLREVDDVPMESAVFFTISSAVEPPLKVNRMTINELKRHPYVNYYQARAIVDYRRQQGRIADLNDLSLLPDFPPEVIERLRPYVSYE